MKMKINVYVLVVSVVTLFMMTMLFKEVPLLVVVASPGPQHDTSVPTQPTSHKNSVPTPPTQISNAFHRGQIDMNPNQLIINKQ